jgi:hypothetical protein
MRGNNKQDKKILKQVKLYCDGVELKRSNIIAFRDKKTIIIEIEEDSTRRI